MADDKTLAMIHFEGFNAVFEQNISLTFTYKNAYEMTESIYERVFKVRKYASYESFMETRRQQLAKNKAKKALLRQINR